MPRRKGIHGGNQGQRGAPVGDDTFFIAVASALFVVVAVVLEAIAGSWANSQGAAWPAVIAPLTWPQPLRVLWWLMVAGAAVCFRVCLHRLGFRQRALVVAMSVAPFVAFAAGVAAGAGWATWH